MLLGRGLLAAFFLFFVTKRFFFAAKGDQKRWPLLGGAPCESDESDEPDEGDDERDGARKLKREHCKRLAECLGIGLLEMQRGARVLVALSRLGDSVSRFLDTVLYRYTGSSLRKAVRP